MKKAKPKKIFFIFLILIVVQFLFGMADVLSYQSNSEFLYITNTTMTIFSFPIGLINRSLPFYINEPLPLKVVFWVLNVIIQSALIYGGISVFKGMKEKLEY